MLSISDKCVLCELEKAGLFGRQSGTVPAFNYSDANKGAKVTWTEATFDEYITDPKKYIPGTKMNFAGLKKRRDRKNLIAFLKTCTEEK
ncbi:unnamed protein product [Oikopleura dioica]|uniref:Cytochrome c domain-containing protein n=1 Tax=Oikopleura dioica TaxID=34765 RepID=E4YFA6_OIKDI|nr:unnamed protein product [Oikopleura dioica]